MIFYRRRSGSSSLSGGSKETSRNSIERRKSIGPTTSHDIFSLTNKTTNNNDKTPEIPKSRKSSTPVTIVTKSNTPKNRIFIHCFSFLENFL